MSCPLCGKDDLKIEFITIHSCPLDAYDPPGFDYDEDDRTFESEPLDGYAIWCNDCEQYIEQGQGFPSEVQFLAPKDSKYSTVVKRAEDLINAIRKLKMRLVRDDNTLMMRKMVQTTMKEVYDATKRHVHD